MRSLWESLSNTVLGAKPEGHHVVHSRRGSFLRHAPLHDKCDQPDGPYVSPDGTVVLWDGRLDNRRTLAALCGLGPPAATRDADIICAAYHRWGQRCFWHFVGDFAVAIWDPKTRDLLLSRDPLGTRPLFYCRTPGVIVFSSDIRPLVEATQARADPDDVYVAGFLASNEDLERTPFPAVRRIRPGSFLKVDGRDFATGDQWWTIPVDRIIKYTSDADYEDHFIELLTTAIACRLTTPSATAELSGGLDSSSIVAIAARLIHGGGVPTRTLNAVSYVYPDSVTSDESRYIVAVENAVGLHSHRITDARIVRSLFSRRCSSVPTPLSLFGDTFAQLDRLLDESHCRLLLSGQGGDHLFVNEPGRSWDLVDHFVSGRTSALIACLQGLHRATQSAYSRLVWLNLVRPTLPSFVLPHRGSDVSPLPHWLSARFLNTPEVTAPFVGEVPDKRLSFAQRRHHSLMMDAISLVSACYYQEWITADVTYPFMHRPLLEFMVAIPFDQKCRHGEQRSVQRRALHGILPELIRTRASKRGPGEALCRAIGREWLTVKSLTVDARIAERGYVEPRAFAAALARVRHGCIDGLQPLSRALVLEAWLRERERPAGTPHDHWEGVGHSPARAGAHQRAHRRDAEVSNS